MTAIKTVAIVGTGVIGSSWAGLFLAHGLRVLVSDPAPDSEQKLSEYLQAVWPDLWKLGLSTGASLDNYNFVGSSLKDHYAELDFVQEVRHMSTILAATMFSHVNRMPPKEWS